MGSNQQVPDYNYSEGLTLHVFEFSKTEHVHAQIVNQDGKPMLAVTAQRKGNQVALHFDGKASGLRVALSCTMSAILKTCEERPQLLWMQERSCL